MPDSKTNFLFAKTDKIEGGELYKELKKRGVLVRHFSKEKISDYIRLPIGTKEQMDVFLSAVKEIISKVEG